MNKKEKIEQKKIFNFSSGNSYTNYIINCVILMMKNYENEKKESGTYFVSNKEN